MHKFNNGVRLNSIKYLDLEIDKKSARRISMVIIEIRRAEMSKLNIVNELKKTYKVTVCSDQN